MTRLQLESQKLVWQQLLVTVDTSSDEGLLMLVQDLYQRPIDFQKDDKDDIERFREYVKIRIEYEVLKIDYALSESDEAVK